MKPKVDLGKIQIWQVKHHTGHLFLLIFNKTAQLCTCEEGLASCCQEALKLQVILSENQSTQTIRAISSHGHPGEVMWKRLVLNQF